MRLIFVDSSLELIPKTIHHHVDVIKSSRIRRKKIEEMLLEDYLHYRAIRKLRNAKKRGRPDIIHRCLLLALDSQLFDEIFVHTIADKIIWVNKNTRLPRTYERFRGLMEKLFKTGKIEINGKVLLEILNYKLEDVLKGKVVVLSENGEKDKFCKHVVTANTICIGAFPKGNFEEETLNTFKKANAKFVRFDDKSCSSLYSTCMVICCINSINGV